MRAPVITAANGMPQPLAWNMGTSWRIVSRSEIRKLSTIASAKLCRNRARCE